MPTEVLMLRPTSVVLQYVFKFETRGFAVQSEELKEPGTLLARACYVEPPEDVTVISTYCEIFFLEDCAALVNSVEVYDAYRTP
jgi:hypothetical protein